MRNDTRLPESSSTTLQVPGVELFAKRGQGGKFRGMFGVVGGKHAGGGPGGPPT